MRKDLPLIKQSDYQIYLSLSIKNYRKFLSKLTEARAKAIEFEKNGERGFISYKELAMGLCSNEYLTNNFTSRLNHVLWDENAIHKINSILDSAIDYLGAASPVPKPTKYETNIMASANQTQSQSVNLDIDFVDKRIDQLLQRYEKGQPEKKFLEKLKSVISSTKDFGQIVVQIVQIAQSVGINIETLKHLVDKIF